MPKLKLQYFGHLMRRADSLEKTVMLGGIGGRRKRGRQRMRWLDGITDWMDMSLSELRELVREGGLDREAWRATVHEVTKSWTRLSDFTFTFHFHALEQEMATHSSVLAWRIPGTWAAVCGVAQTWTRLKRLSSSSCSRWHEPLPQKGQSATTHLI